MAQELPDLGDYLAALRRRKLWAGGTVLLVALAAVYLAYGVAPTYRAEATILIEQQEIPEQFVRSTVTGYADERIQTIAQRVMTRDNLLSVAEQHDLFPEIRASGNFADLVAAMTDAIFLETVQVQTLDESRARTYPITIAFDVAFEYTDPEKTRTVTRQLADLYLQENSRSRSALANETLSFLEREAVRLRANIDELEVRIAEFKEANRDTLPDLADLNREMLRRTETDLQLTREAISQAQDRRNLLLAELRTTPPTAPIFSESGEPILTADERLRALQAQYLSLSATYSPDHPDLQRLRREIQALQGTTGGGLDVEFLRAELGAREAELEDARGRYSEDHPTVRRLSGVVAALREQVAASGPSQRSSGQTAPTNPVYVQLQVQLANVDRELRQLNEKAARLESELAEYTARFAQMPQTEREWLTLTRDHDTAVTKYQEMLGQLEEARRAVTLESVQKGERFTLIDPPRLPEAPVRPNQPVILMVGLLFALAGCAGIVALLEMLDGTVRGPRDLRTLLDVPALATVPYVANARDRRNAILRRIGLSAVVAACAVYMAFLIVV